LLLADSVDKDTDIMIARARAVLRARLGVMPSIGIMGMLMKCGGADGVKVERFDIRTWNLSCFSLTDKFQHMPSIPQLVIRRYAFCFLVIEFAVICVSTGTVPRFGFLGLNGLNGRVTVITVLNCNGIGI